MATMKLGSKSEIFELDGCTWLCKNELASDIIVEIGEMSFHLHKFPLLNRSGLLQRLISEHKSEDDGKICTIQLHDLLGGAKTFELVAKFCYDVKIEITAHNVVNLRCASEYLRMTEDYISGNLISHTENFLTEISNNWKDSIKALESCESNLPLAEDLHIVTRCINSLAAKSFADPSLFGWPIKTTKNSQIREKGENLWNGICTNDKSNSPGGDWWYEDVSYLSLPLYKRLILAMGEKGMSPEYIAGSLMYYAKSYVPGLTRDSSVRTVTNQISPASIFAPTESDQRVVLEEVVGLLPEKKGVASTKFLLRLLRTAMILHASVACRENLETRIGTQLEKAALEDILIPNLGYSVETLYDIDCVQRIVDHFMMSYSALTSMTIGEHDQNSPERITDEEQMLPNGGSNQTPMTMVAKLVDGYLAEVGPDVNLKLTKFQALASVVPEYARQLDDGIYRAIDIYLKSHPWLTESEREQLCRLMNCQKLSLEACTHAAQNERLPLRVVVQILFFEQMRLRALISGWFFVSEGAQEKENGGMNLQGEGRHSMLPKFFDSNGENVDEMRVCILELEKKCSSMKLEIEKLGKAKSSGWSFFGRRFGFGSKSETTVKDK